MKICVATGLYPPEIGGPATYATMLEAELPQHGLEVTIVPFGWVRRYPKIIRHLMYLQKLWRESREADVIYALDPISVGVPALMVARLRRKPFLIRLGGDYAWEQGRARFGLTGTLDEYLAKPKGRPVWVCILAAVQAFVVKRADRVIAPSFYLKSVIAKWGVPEARITVIYSALFPLFVNEKRDTLRQQLRYRHPTIVSAGRLVPWKGFRVLIEATAKLQQTYPEVMLVIAGDGGERIALEEYAAELGISKRVRFVGNVSKDTLGAIIKAADVFVLNTAYEGLSHQLLEVMDLGTPIVTTPAGGNAELISDRVTGYLVKYNNCEALVDAMSCLFEHEGSRHHLVQAARLRSKEFSKERVIEQLLVVLNKAA
jgi:glycosyltransferase involved in cell wall biosynthesis